MISSKFISVLTLAASIFGSSVAFAADVPAEGVSPRIDAIKEAGVLRVGVLANTPWLVENTTGSGEPWEGPAWILAQEYAKQLGVTLQPVPVSHETKVPVLASNQVDLSITPLAETPERLKVVDFVLYSKTSVCIFGRKDNEKFSNAGSVDAINNADFTVAYFIGGGEENWVKERFPNAKLRGVTSSSAPAPIEEIMAKRADVAAINRIQWVLLNKKVPGLSALPQENNCQDSSEKAAPVGLAIDKGQTAFLDWLRAVEKEMQPKLAADEARIVETMK
ncbi:substrate-binding periplasmic protein [Sinorhizobium mexicanum]|uniref:Transporter substrate-binding domain-containing protein n=1 Tax=Sinorhizobium mexicanum TaxID=375549 RepID=A0A859R8U3_9HYPH|nr:transporter substrate-binding domain-containing protein [Sinorhizobium mexicanum]MBP1887281.1 polar amino acid transport system substrate-binding protein [Sinorhizobium mexicanum]QLL65828.1 transporter substrate-binding domain-containing protein [Sinorhizobium mexicanum]